MQTLKLDNLNTVAELNHVTNILGFLYREASDNDDNRFFAFLRKPSKLSRTLKIDFDKSCEKYFSLGG